MNNFPHLIPTLLSSGQLPAHKPASALIVSKCWSWVFYRQTTNWNLFLKTLEAAQSRICIQNVISTSRQWTDFIEVNGLAGSHPSSTGWELLHSLHCLEAEVVWTVVKSFPTNSPKPGGNIRVWTCGRSSLCTSTTHLLEFKHFALNNTTNHHTHWFLVASGV